MFRSVKLGSIRGIGVYIHWTFWMLVAIYAFTETARSGLAGGIEASLFIGAVFACVLAHEFGHAAAAAHYGIKTTDITLMIVGGMARLARLPDRPVHELVIAVAGPAVNVMIGAVLFVLLAFGALVPEPTGLLRTSLLFAQSLLIANVVLVLFNMLPAFPMDGGRVLRSLLAMRQGQLRATETAAQVGRWMAVLFAIAAVAMWEFPLLLVAGFVYVAGSAELMQVRLRSMTSAGTGGGTSNPFAGFGRTSESLDPLAFRTAGRDDVIDAVEVREIPRD
jgi:Zn-dependent protease